MYSSTCEITGKTLTIENSDFLPKSYAPTSVTTLKISSSTIPRLTASICKPFPNLNKIVVREVSLEEVDEDTFVQCKQLTEIDLEKNYITEFKKNTFNRNPTLENLQLWLNRLQSIDDDLFANLTTLTTIDLSSNNISHFPAVIARDMEKLTTLSLCNNRILDVETKEMLEHLPKLRTLNLRDNDLECGRWREIRADILAKNLNISTVTDTIRIRPYGIRKIDGVECVDKPQWEHLKTMRHMEGTIKELKSDVNKTEEEIVGAQEHIDKVKDTLSQQIAYNEIEIKNLESMKTDVNKVIDTVDQMRANTSVDLEKIYKRIDSDKTIIMQEVNENKVKFQTLSKYVDTELLNLKKNFSSKDQEIEDKIAKNDAKYKTLIEEAKGSNTGIWTFTILLAIAVLITALAAGIIIRRSYNRIMIVLNKVVGLKHVSDGDEERNGSEFVNPHPL